MQPSTPFVVLCSDSSLPPLRLDGGIPYAVQSFLTPSCPPSSAFFPSPTGSRLTGQPPSPYPPPLLSLPPSHVRASTFPRCRPKVFHLSSCAISLFLGIFALHEGYPCQRGEGRRVPKTHSSGGQTLSCCKSQVSGDHVVGWANSSLRFQYQLPPAEVFLDQNIREADSDDPSVVLPNTGSTPDRQQIGPFMRHPASLPTPSRPASDAELDKQVQRRMKHSRSCAARLASAPPLRSSPSRVRPYINTTVSSMLLRLQAMSWRRIDVSYARHPSFFMAHNHIQVTRKWLNKAGIPTVEHLVHLLGEMEAGLQAGIASPSSVPGQQHNQQEEA